MARGRRIVIIGNGIAGITAARHIRKRDADCQILVISGETEHFFSRTALMYIYMGHMRYEDTKPYADSFWDDNRIELVLGWVARVDPTAKQVIFDDGAELPYDVLILAPGSQSNKFGWPGQDLDGVQGLYSYPDLEQMERFTDGIERGVVIGGGLIGIETAEMLHSRDIPVTFLVREPSWMANVFPAEESELINREIRQNGIDLRLGAELDRIEAGPDGRAAAVVTKDGETVPCGFVALTVGVHPNIGFLKESEIETDRGILVDDHLRTNIPDVYAAGDCVQLREAAPGRRPIEEQLDYAETVLAMLLNDDTIEYLGRIKTGRSAFILQKAMRRGAPASAGQAIIEATDDLSNATQKDRAFAESALVDVIEFIEVTYIRGTAEDYVLKSKEEQMRYMQWKTISAQAGKNLLKLTQSKEPEPLPEFDDLDLGL